MKKKILLFIFIFFNLYNYTFAEDFTIEYQTWEDLLWVGYWIWNSFTINENLKDKILTIKTN